MRSRFVVLGLCAALLGATAVVVDGAAASGGPVAGAAKKKCKKHRAAATAKKKCKKGGSGGGTTQDPIANATAFLAGHSLSYLSYSNTTGASTQYRYDFCGNGTFHFRGDYVGVSSYAWADSYDGTWKVSSATATSAQVAFTTSNYQVSDPYYASPPPASGTVGIQAQSDVVVLVDGAQFSRGAGTC